MHSRNYSNHAEARTPTVTEKFNKGFKKATQGAKPYSTQTLTEGKFSGHTQTNLGKKGVHVGYEIRDQNGNLKAASFDRHIYYNMMDRIIDSGRVKKTTTAEFHDNGTVKQKTIERDRQQTKSFGLFGPEQVRLKGRDVKEYYDTGSLQKISGYRDHTKYSGPMVRYTINSNRLEATHQVINGKPKELLYEDKIKYGVLKNHAGKNLLPNGYAQEGE